MPHPRSASGTMLVTILAMTLAGTGRADEGTEYEQITPYRPSVSTPAQLPFPGQLELELGGQGTGGASRRGNLPYLFKLAFNNEWGLLVGGDAYIWSRGDDGRFEGVGDTNVTLKRAWVVDKETAFGLEFNVKLPTAKDPLGSGKADYDVNAIYSQDFGPVHMDANMNLTQLGLVDPGSSRTQLGGASAFSVNLSKHWGMLGEVSGTHRAGADNGLQLLCALTFSPSKTLTFDMGLSRALRPRPATTSLFAGVVLPLARLW
ncbi:transporter [Variovorax sp. dw_954]|uniref:transporter n=1 Tax=Variovorax sp. dw_954 TaxID=2720078 RepID=UPI002116F104|nr:transporter [Variovorax sp. dw_954]